jgi:hypothetical protein
VNQQSALCALTYAHLAACFAGVTLGTLLTSASLLAVLVDIQSSLQAPQR